VIDTFQQRYGRDQVAQIITFGTRSEGVLRDVGRVLQCPMAVDKLTKLVRKIRGTGTLAGRSQATKLQAFRDEDPVCARFDIAQLRG